MKHSKPEHSNVVILLPVFNESETIEGLLAELSTVFSQSAFELSVLIVNDGSTDKTSSVLQNIESDVFDISVLEFSRNFGKEAALMAGINEAGDDFDFLAYMDSDGQHDPADLLKLLEIAVDKRAEITCGIRQDRDYQSKTSRLLSNLFYSMFSKLANYSLDRDVGDFNVLSRNVVETLRSMPEQTPFMKGLIG